MGVPRSTLVALRDVQLPESMRRAMARQAEAEREKRAKMIHAEGELAASEKLAAAAAIIGTEPVGIQLRFLQTLTRGGGRQEPDGRLPATHRPYWAADGSAAFRRPGVARRVEHERARRQPGLLFHRGRVALLTRSA